LEGNSRKASENFVHVQYLLGDGFGILDQQRAGGASQTVKLCPIRQGHLLSLPIVVKG
jgi:hypothetical protein